MMLRFPGGLASDANGTLIFSIIAAIAYLMVVNRSPSRSRTVAKTLATALLAVLVGLQGGPVALIAALALGAIGDALLAQDGDTAFLAGLGSFLGAHLIYLGLFWIDGGGPGLLIDQPWRCVALLAMLALAVFMCTRLMPVIDTAMKAPVVIYVVAIAMMGLAALTLQKPLVLIGAMLFIASDTILAIEKFLLGAVSPHRQWTPYAVWILYYSGQAAIALGYVI